MCSREGIPKGCSLSTGSEVEGWGSEGHVGEHCFAHLKMKEKVLEPFFFFLNSLEKGSKTFPSRPVIAPEFSLLFI